MRKLLFLVLIAGVCWYMVHDKYPNFDINDAVGQFQSELTALKDDPDFSNLIDRLSDDINQLGVQLNESIKQLPQNKEEIKSTLLEKPALSAPSAQIFSIYNIELGDKKAEVEKELGQAKRSTYNEYGVKWYAYHKNYQHFLMVSYDKSNEVVGLYTNQDLISSSKGIKLGTPKDKVLKELGKPMDRLQKGLVYYLLPKERDYDLFLLGDSYTTVFYDKHQKNTVTAIQMIKKDIEREKEDFYTEGNKQLEEGFEYQLFDLTNAARVQHGQPVLTWDSQVKGTAQKHSKDMAVNSFFDHTNLKGQSPFDRMEEDHITYRSAGENIAYGQLSSIFAHEGLMNSLGHRENILKPDFRLLGVGVAFNSESQPYYTENFYTK
ncbi:CAP domain-containing protein [Peribacillus deserti]|uniref:Serine protease n=1 Tax=Peribacillus deserti TaxID=673318 RepID=A0A2N5M508_9BACI|nr:CAP domain-containing protein [Peribacillus deserti]PLT29425.1 serine protease [Peribacillus deserti]